MRYTTFLEKVGTILYHFAGILFIALASCMAIQILLRYTVGVSFPWMEEMSRFLMVWLGFVGAAACSQRRAHIRFGMDIIEKFSIRAAKYVFICILAVFNVFLLLLTVTGVSVVLQNMNVHSSALPIPFGIVLIIIPLMGGLMLIFHTHELYELWNSRGEQS